MNIKVNNSGRVSQTSKKGKANKTNKTDGPSFASMVEQAQGVEDTQSASAVSGVGSTPAYTGPLQDDVPTEARGRGAYMLDQLEELEQDILSGSPTQAVEKLRAALGTEATGAEELPTHVKTLLDEIEMRVSVEIAKMEEGKKKQD